MTRSLHHVALAAGLLTLAWVGSGYIPGNPLALALVLLIGAFFITGAIELQRFRQATAGLADTLATTTEPPAELPQWIAALHPSLRNAVRLRVEGERVGLPGPALAPYLAGLVVLLGMLGTFLGMVVTLRGTGLALENATDVASIRASLAAPVKGLGLAFGTSVAGVAASAALGLMSALARRDRQRVAQQLDARIAGALRGFSRAHQREESVRLLKAQSEVLPALVAQLENLVAQTNRQGQALQESLLANQQQFHGEAQRAYTGLADAVSRSLQTSMAESARLAGAAIEPAVQATMAGLARETAALHERLASAVQGQFDGVDARFDAMAATLAERWRASLADQQRHGEAVTQNLHDGMERFAQAFEQRAAAHERERMTTFHDGVAAMSAKLEHTAQAIHGQAETQARAAAEVIAEMRRALSESLVRDNAALQERNQLLGTLGGLLDAVNHAGTEQRAAIDALVNTTAGVLEQVGARFAQTVDAESRTLQQVAAQVGSGAAEVASLGEGFGVAVQLFSDASERLTAQLGRIEGALGHSLARSDEQLAYYVAQAREIIDLTLGSQKQIVEDLQHLAKVAAPA